MASARRAVSAIAELLVEPVYVYTVAKKLVAQTSADRDGGACTYSSIRHRPG